MSRSTVSPPIWRVVIAFVIAPAFASLLYAAIFPLYQGLSSPDRIYRTAILVAVIVYVFTLLFVVPAFLLLRERVKATVVNCAITGALISALPWLVLLVLSTPGSAVDGAHVTVEHGVRTLWGWAELSKFLGMAALFGAVGGLVFWLVAVAGLRAVPNSALAAD
jgi:hypothetical protein